MGLATATYMYRLLRSQGFGYSWWDQLESFKRYLKMIRAEKDPAAKLKYKVLLGLYAIAAISLLGSFLTAVKMDAR